METLLNTREKLQALIEIEWTEYRKAVKEDKPFEEVKAIHLRIKKLEEEIAKVTNEIRDRLNIAD